MTESPCDVTEAEVTPALEDASAEVNVDGKPAVVGDENWECLPAFDGFMVPEGEVLEVDITEGDVVPIRYLMRSFGTTDDAGIADDSIPVETFGFDEMQVSDEEFAIQDFVSDENPPTEEWDPSWAYQSFVAFDGVATDGEPTDEVTENVDDSEVKVKIYHSLKPDAADDGVIFEELVAIEDTPPVDGWDPSWAYRSFAGSPEGALDGELKIDDIVPEDEVPVDENVTFEDAPPVDGWDPSWLYRSFGGSPEGAIDDAVKTDDIEMEDGVTVDEMVVNESVTPEDAPPVDGRDPSWIFCPVDESWLYGTVETPDAESLDSDGDGIPDDFVTDPIYSDGSFDPHIMMTFGGGVDNVKDSGIDVADGEAKEVNDFDDSVIEEELYLYPVDEVVEFGDEEFQVSDSDDSTVPQIRFLSAAGGSVVQRTLSDSSDSAIELAVAASAPQAGTTEATTSAVIPSLPSLITTNVVPVRPATSNSLFSASRDKSTIGVALTLPSGSGTVGSPPGTKSTSTPKRAKSLLQSNSNNSDETSGLENLSPLIGGDVESPEVDSATGPKDLQVNDQITAEPAVSRNENVNSESNAVVKRTRQDAKIRSVMIDEVMSQYAENSFNA